MAPSFLPSSVGYLTEKKGMNKLSEGGGTNRSPLDYFSFYLYRAFPKLFLCAEM